MKRIVVIGATSAIAQAYARYISLRQDCSFVLVGRNEAQLIKVAKDLVARNPRNEVTIECGDLESPSFVQEIASRVVSQAPVDIVLIAQGVLPDQSAVQNSPNLLAESISINATSPAMFADKFATLLSGQTKESVIGIIGSVAGDRGRKSNYSYGAAKAFIETYSRGLQHRLEGTGVQVLLIKPGPVNTPMTTHLQGKLKSMASTESVAIEIDRAISSRKPTLYTPRKWALIMFVIRSIPAAVFNKLNL